MSGSDKPGPRDPFDREMPDLATLRNKYGNTLPGNSIPVTWKDGHTGQKMKGKPLIILPSAEDAELYSARQAKTCGGCRFFDLETGRKEIVRQRFAEKLEREYDWRLRHLGANPEALGLCGASGGQTMTAVHNKACDQWRERGRR